jgi:hypothetical protein
MTTARRETSFSPNYDAQPRQDGDFLSQKSRNPVVERILIDEGETEHASIHEYLVHMHNETFYKLREAQPKSRAVDVAYLRTPAWTTSHNKGYEKEYSEHMAKIGMAVLTITPQQNLLGVGNMSKNAHDYVTAGQYFAERSGLDSTRFVTGGSSRGAMHSLAMAKVAPAHEAHVDYIDSISPCLPQGIVISKLGQVAKRLCKEPARLLRIANEHPQYIGVLANTITTDLREQFQQLKEIVPLTSGMSGQLAARMPEDTFGYVQQYRDDGLAHPEQWPEILDRFPNIYHAYDSGAHLDCVSPEMLAASVRRMEYVRDGLVSGAVGSVALHDMVAVGNPEFEGESSYPLRAVAL